MTTNSYGVFGTLQHNLLLRDFEVQLAQFNYIAGLGKAEQTSQTVTLRRRGEIKQFGTLPLAEVLKMFHEGITVNSFNHVSGLEPFFA